MSGPDDHDVPVFAVVGRVDMGKSFLEWMEQWDLSFFDSASKR